MTLSIRLSVSRLVNSFRRKGPVETLKSCAAELEEIWFDRKFGVDTLETTSDRTQGLFAWMHPEYNLWYQPTKIWTLKRIFSDLQINYEDFIFLDLGSGKGRALLLASEFPFRRIIGVELIPELHAIAEKNIKAYRSTTQRCCAIESHCSDATLYPVPTESTVLFFNNTLKTPAVSRLLTNLQDSMLNYPRQLYIVYKSVKLQGEDPRNPVCHDLMKKASFLESFRVTELYAIYKGKRSSAAVSSPEHEVVERIGHASFHSVLGRSSNR